MSSFVLLVSASLTSGFRLLLLSYGRFFIEFLLSKIAEDTISRAFSLKTTKRAFHVFVFSDSNRRHSQFTILCQRISFYSVIITGNEGYVKLFFTLFKPFYKNLPRERRSFGEVRLLLSKRFFYSPAKQIYTWLFPFLRTWRARSP